MRPIRTGIGGRAARAASIGYGAGRAVSATRAANAAVGATIATDLASAAGAAVPVAYASAWPYYGYGYSYPYYGYTYFGYPALYSTYLSSYVPWRVYGTEYTGPVLPVTDHTGMFVQALAAHGAASGHPPLTLEEFMAKVPISDPKIDPAKVGALRDDLRHLWRDHASLTRNLIISVAGKLPDTAEATSRLLKNQDEIADAMREYVGDEVADQVGKMLRDHVMLTSDMLAAAKGTDASKTEKAKSAWYNSGDDLAKYLGSANPSWQQADLQRMIRAHLEATWDEAAARMAGRWADDLAAYDRVAAGVMDMSDALGRGIVETYPEAFVV